MALVMLELDEDFHVAIARALVEAPQCALVAAANPEGPAGHIALADTYDEAVQHAEEFIAQGWRAIIWEVGARRGK